MALITGTPTAQLSLSLIAAAKPEEEEERDASEASFPPIAHPIFIPPPPEPPMFRAGNTARFRERIHHEESSVGKGLAIAGGAIVGGAAIVFAWPAVVAAAGGKGLFVLGALAVGAIAAACQPEIKREVPGYELNPKRTGITDPSLPAEPNSKQSATELHWIGKKKSETITRTFSLGMNLIYDETTVIDLCAPYRDPQGNPITDPNRPHRMQDVSTLDGIGQLDVTVACFHGNTALPNPFNPPFRFDAMPTSHSMRTFAPIDDSIGIVRGGDMPMNALFCNQDQPFKEDLFLGQASCAAQITDRSGNAIGPPQAPVKFPTIDEIDGCTTLTRPLFYGRDDEQSGPWFPAADEVNYQHFWCWSAPAVLPGILTDKFAESFDPDLGSYERTFCTTKGGSDETDCRRINPNLEAIDRDWCLPTMRDGTVFRTLPVPPEEAPCFLGRERGISDANPARTYCLIERVPADPGTGPGTNSPATFTTEKWPPQAGVENPHELFIQMTWCEDRAAWEKFRKTKDGE